MKTINRHFIEMKSTVFIIIIIMNTCKYRLRWSQY